MPKRDVISEREIILGRDAILALIPHQGTMCLLDRIVEWDSNQVVLATRTHRSADNPLRLDGRLRAIHLCEYGAQAMAVHGGLSAQSDGKTARPGFLVSLRDVTLNVDFIDALEGEIMINAQRLLESAGSWQYSFAATHAGETLASGRAAIMAR
jgi:predicted hotdog family 3-hydroxylacyl-ACP dehydratase